MNIPISKFIIKDRHGNPIRSDSFATVSQVVVSADNGVGEASADASYEEGVLRINFHNIKADGIQSVTFEESQEDGGTNYLHVKMISDSDTPSYTFPIKNGRRGNGITSIDVEESQVDGGDNIVHIHCTDDEEVEGTTFRVKNGRRGNGITSIETKKSQDIDGVDVTIKTTDNQGGVTFQVRNGIQGKQGEQGEQGEQGIQGEKGEPLTWNDLTEPQKASLKGQQGDSAVYNPDDPDTPVFVMANGMGDSTTKAMTQKAITDEIIDASYMREPFPYKDSEMVPATITGNGKWFDMTDSPMQGCLILPIEGGITIEVASENQFHIEFLLNDTHVHNTTPAYSTDNARGWTETPGTYIIKVPLTTKFIYMRKLNNGVDALPDSINKLVKISTDYQQVKEKVEAISSEYLPINKTEGYSLRTNGTAVADEGWNYTDFIPCEANDNVACNYNKAATNDKNISCLQFFNQGKDFISAVSVTASGDNKHSQSVVAPIGTCYVKFCYYLRGDGVGAAILINGKIAWHDEMTGVLFTEDDERCFLSSSTVKNYGGIGQNSTAETISLGHLVPGARYRVVIDDTTGIDTYIASQTETNARFWLRPILLDDTNGNTIFSAFKNVPMPHQIDFVAKENKEYVVGFRAAAETTVNFRLIGAEYDKDKNKTILVKHASFKRSGDPTFKIFHFSDIHADNNAAVKILAEIDKYKDYLDDILFTGDAVYQRVGLDVGSAEFWANSGLAEKALFTLGNHDFLADNWKYVNVKSKAWCHETYIAPYISTLGYVMPNGYENPNSQNYKACYWHKDYADQKVRLIGLDAMHIFDGVVNPATGEVVTAGTKGNEQELWLVEKLTETLSGGSKAGWSVIVCGHLPLDQFDDTNNANKEWDDVSHAYICNMRGGRVVNQKTGEISNWHDLNSIKWGTDSSFGRQFYDMYGINNIAEILNYYNNQSGSHFVAYIHGHHHTSMMYYPTNYPNLLDFGIEEAGARLSDMAFYEVKGFGDYIANIISFDIERGLMKVVRLGVNSNIQLTPRNYLCYDYINRRVISEG